MSRRTFVLPVLLAEASGDRRKSRLLRPHGDAGRTAQGQPLGSGLPELDEDSVSARVERARGERRRNDGDGGRLAGRKRERKQRSCAACVTRRRCENQARLDSWATGNAD